MFKSIETKSANQLHKKEERFDVPLIRGRSVAGHVGSGGERCRGSRGRSGISGGVELLRIALGQSLDIGARGTATSREEDRLGTAAESEQLARQAHLEVRRAGRQRCQTVRDARDGVD